MIKVKMFKGWTLIPVSLALIIGTLGCFGPIIPFEQEETRTKDMSGTAIMAFSVTTSNGMVKVSTVASTLITVVATKKSEGNTRADAETRIKCITISESVSDGVFKIETDFPNDPFGSYSVAYDITLPATLNVTLRTSNGNIEVTGIQNAVDADTSNGDINMTTIIGSVKADTSNGKIDLNGIQGSVDATSSNGDLDVDAIFPTDGHIIMDTSNGDIILTILENTSAQVDARTSNGKVTSEVAITIEGAQGENELKGKMGGGQGTIKLTSSNGDISIKKK